MTNHMITGEIYNIYRKLATAGENSREVYELFIHFERACDLLRIEVLHNIHSDYGVGM